MEVFAVVIVCLLPPAAVSRPVKPVKEEDTKIDAFGVELSTNLKWLLLVALLVIGILAIVYIAVKKFLEYDFPSDEAAAAAARLRHREPFLKRCLRYFCTEGCGLCPPKQLRPNVRNGVLSLAEKPASALKKLKKGKPSAVWPPQHLSTNAKIPLLCVACNVVKNT